MTADPAKPGAKFHVLHSTRFRYAEPVSASHHHAVLLIREAPRQTTAYSRLSIDPEPERLHTREDYFGNNLTRFSIDTTGHRLQVDADSEVQLDRGPVVTPDSPTLEGLAREIHLARKPDDLRALEFVFDSPYVSRSGVLAAYAAEGFESGVGFLCGVEQLMHRMHREFAYDPAVTEISTPIRDVFARKEGVCQDFAHLMIGCLRSLDIPARYVSGYLVPLPGVVGTQASHAWISAYSPGLGWVDFDPTNDVIPAGGHITVGWGRDYADVSPVRGVVRGGGEHTVDVAVKVVEII